MDASELVSNAGSEYVWPGCLDVSGHFKPASNGRNVPATLVCVCRHFSSNQTRRNSLISGLFERKMPLFSSHLMQDSLAGLFRPLVAGLISTGVKAPESRPLAILAASTPIRGPSHLFPF